MDKDEKIDKILEENNRRLDRILKRYGRIRNHSINAYISTRYHRCKGCGASINDEVLLVVEKLRSGDKYHVFCNIHCLKLYDKWPE